MNICEFHQSRNPRFFNGNCWYCRKAELRYLADVEIENGERKHRPPGLSAEVIATICRVRRVARIKKSEIIPNGSYPMTGLMSYSEIGAILGISEQAVQQICSNALRKLRRKPIALKVLVDLSDERHRCLPLAENKPLMETIA